MAPTATEGNGSEAHIGASRKAAVGTPPALPKFASKEKEREFLKFRLAQAFRIFGKLGYDEGVAGHITVRDSIRPDCFWVNPFGKHFSLIQPSDLILVDHHGKVQAEESGPNKLLNTAAFMIHSAIHAARPDVNCAAHSHSVYGRAFSTFGRHLDMITQDSCAFYQDHGVYDQYGGVVLNEDEGAHIVKALGDKKAVILQNHGILVASDTIEATVHFFIAMEKSCQVQLLADAAAAGHGKKPVIINDADAKMSHSVVGTMYGGWFSGQPHFQLLEATEGVKFDVEKGIAVKL
ncbi:class II aldolase/adducin domain-containing protein [Trametes sanguinea]|nr:class II aldolase/adducin domain-containing protein [Trametes sanguinea]